MMPPPGYRSSDSLASSPPVCGSSTPADGQASSTTDDGATQDTYLDQHAVCRSSSDLSCSSCPSLDLPSSLACAIETPPSLTLSSPCYTDTDAFVLCRRQKKRRKCEKEEEHADGLRHQNSLSSCSSLAVSHLSCSSGEDWKTPPLSSSASLNTHLPTSSSSSLSSPLSASGHSYSTPDTSPPPCSTPARTHKEQENPSSSHFLGTSSSSPPNLLVVSACSSSATCPRTSSSSETAFPVLPRGSSSSTPLSSQNGGALERDQAQERDGSGGLSSPPLPSPSFPLPSEVGLSTQRPAPLPQTPHRSASPCSRAPPSLTLPSCSCRVPPPCSSSSSLSFAQKIIRQVLLRCSVFFASLQLLPCCCPLPLHPLLNPVEVANLPRLLTLIELSSGGGGPCQYAGGGKRPGRQGGQGSKAEHHSTPLSDATTPVTPPHTGHVGGPRETQHEKTRENEDTSHTKERDEVREAPEGLRNEKSSEIQITSHQDGEEEMERPLSKVGHQGARVDQENLVLRRNDTYDSSGLIEEEKEKEKFLEESQFSETAECDVAGMDGKVDAGIVASEFSTRESGECVENRYCHEGRSCADDMTDLIHERVGDERLSETSSCSPHLPREELLLEQSSLETIHDDPSKKRTHPVPGVEEEKKRLVHEAKEEEEKEGKTEEEELLRTPCDSSRNSYTGEGQEQEGQGGTERVAEDEDNRSGDEKPLVITNATELFEDGSGVGRQRTLHWLRRTLREEMTNPNVEGFLLYLRRPSSSSSFHFVACARLEIIEDGDASLSWLLLPKGLSKESEEELLLSFFVYVICIYLLVMPYKLRPGIDALHPVLTPLMLLQKKEQEAERRRKAELTKATKNTERKKEKRKKKESEKEAKNKVTEGNSSGEPEGEKEAMPRPSPPEVQAALLSGTRPPTETSKGDVEGERPKIEQRRDQEERKMMVSGVWDEVREGGRSKIVEGAVTRMRCEASAYPEIPDVLRLPDKIYETIEGENDALFGDDRIFPSTPRLGEGDGQADEHLHEKEPVGSEKEEEGIDADDETRHTERPTPADVETADKTPQRTRTHTTTTPSVEPPLSTDTAEYFFSPSSPSSSYPRATLTSCLPSSLPWGTLPSTSADGPPSHTSTSFSSSLSSAACCTLPQANAELLQSEDDQDEPPGRAADRGQKAESTQDLGFTQRHDDTTPAYPAIRDPGSYHGENVEGLSVEHNTMRRGMFSTFQLLLRSLVPLPKEPNLHCRLTVDCGDLLLCPRPLLQLLLDRTPFCRGGLAHKEPDNSEVPKDIRLHQQISFHLYHLIPLRNPQAYGCKPWYKSPGSRRPRGGGRARSGMKKSARNEARVKNTGEKEETRSSIVLENKTHRKGRSDLEQSEGETKDVREARRQLSSAISSGCVFHSHISNAGECCCQVQGAWPLRLFMFHAKELVLKIFPLLLVGSSSPSDTTSSISQTPYLSSANGDPSCGSYPSSQEAAAPDILTQPPCPFSSCPAGHPACCQVSPPFTEGSAAAYKPKGYSTMRLPFTPSPQLQAELRRILGVKGAGPTHSPGPVVVPTSPSGVREVSGVGTPPPPSHLRRTNAHREDVSEPTERDSLSSRKGSPQGRLPTTPPGGKVTSSDVSTTSPAQQGSSHQHLQQQLTEKLWSTAKVETFAHPQDTAIRACEEQAAHAISAAFEEFHTLLQGSGGWRNGRMNVGKLFYEDGSEELRPPS